MRAIALSPRAEVDLEEIWDYTAERWSEDQAEQYVRELWQAISSGAEKPNRGLPCDDVRTGYRKYPAGKHMLFYRESGSAIEIIRILHQRMNFGRHL